MTNCVTASASHPSDIAFEPALYAVANLGKRTTGSGNPLSLVTETGRPLENTPFGGN